MWTRASYLCSELSIICVWKQQKQLSTTAKDKWIGGKWFEGPLSAFHTSTGKERTSIKLGGKGGMKHGIEDDWKSAIALMGVWRVNWYTIKRRICWWKKRLGRCWQTLSHAGHGRQRSKATKVTKYQGSHQAIRLRSTQLVSSAHTHTNSCLSKQAMGTRLNSINNKQDRSVSYHARLRFLVG